jgi:hypothetical protein
MSWQATAWAVRQKTGSAARKALLLVLANYADEHGVCWPSQETLMAETELSADTIQRQSKVLKNAGLVQIVRRPRKGGNWPGLLYQLNLSFEASTMPQDAAWSEPITMPHPAAHHAALTTSTMPQALRHKPPYEPPSKPSVAADDARESGPSKSLISPEAYTLCDDLMRLQRFDKDDPRCIGMAYGIQGWLSKGWNADVIRQAVEAVMARCPRAPRTLRYFEAAIAEAHAERDRPLPIANPPNNNISRVANGTHRNGGFIRNAIRLAQQASDG